MGCLILLTSFIVLFPLVLHRLDLVRLTKTDVSWQYESRQEQNITLQDILELSEDDVSHFPQGEIPLTDSDREQLLTVSSNLLGEIFGSQTEHGKYLQDMLLNNAQVEQLYIMVMKESSPASLQLLSVNARNKKETDRISFLYDIRSETLLAFDYFAVEKGALPPYHEEVLDALENYYHNTLALPDSQYEVSYFDYADMIKISGHVRLRDKDSEYDSQLD